MPASAKPEARSAPHGVTILGATGSIGASTLDVVARHPDRYRVVALTANNQDERLCASGPTAAHRPQLSRFETLPGASAARGVVRRDGIGLAQSSDRPSCTFGGRP